MQKRGIVLKTTFLVAAGLLLLLAHCAEAQTDRQALANTAYDAYFERWSARWLPEYDWQWLRAQCFQESRFNPRAVSPAGARGICQLMPGTARDLGVSDSFNVSDNIRGGAQYMRRMINIWHAPRTDYERLELSQASYNAGAGHIIQAQRLCDGAPDWQTIKTCLPRVTGHHSAETIDYVRRIRRWYWEQQCRPA
jgi:membrane-bound lytic murein transglycosylase MltF